MGQEEGRETGRSGEPGLFPVLGRKVGLAAFCSGHRRNSLSMAVPDAGRRIGIWALEDGTGKRCRPSTDLNRVRVAESGVSVRDPLWSLLQMNSRHAFSSHPPLPPP